MKIKPAHIHNYFKLFYLLVILSSTYVLKLAIGMIEGYEAIYLTSTIPEMCEYIFVSLMILNVGYIYFLLKRWI